LKTFWKIAFVVLAILSGVGIGVYRIADFDNSTAVFKNGSWKGSENLPLGKDNLLTAQITAFALFALPSSEAIYLMASKDNNQERLTSENDYILTSNVGDIKAKYWSITAYGTDLFLIPNEINRYSFNNRSIIADSSGNFKIHLSTTKREGNWLPTPKKLKFYLVMRIYGGEADFLASLDISTLPIIKKYSDI
jgi:hypothetical protein